MKEITFNLEAADLKAYFRHYCRVSPSVRRANVIMLVLVGVVSLQLSARGEEIGMNSRVGLFFVYYILGSLIALTFAFLVNYAIQSRSWQDSKRHGLLCEHTFALTPETLRTHTAASDANISWKGIYRIDATASHLFFFVQPELAYIIPRGAFPTPEAAEEFLATARAYHGAAVAPVSTA